VNVRARWDSGTSEVGFKSGWDSRTRSDSVT
jgi:hypothetical protein